MGRFPVGDIRRQVYAGAGRKIRSTSWLPSLDVLTETLGRFGIPYEVGEGGTGRTSVHVPPEWQERATDVVYELARFRFRLSSWNRRAARKSLRAAHREAARACHERPAPHFRFWFDVTIHERLYISREQACRRGSAFGGDVEAARAALRDLGVHGRQLTGDGGARGGLAGLLEEAR